MWGQQGKLIPARSFALTIVIGFRDGRHELSPLCPGACGARPRLVGDSIRLRRGHLRGHRHKARPARACRFRDGPARDPGKSPRAGCLGHHHQTFKSGHDVRRASRTPLIAPGRKLVEGFVLTRLSSPFYGEVDRRKAARRRGAAPAASCLRQAPPPPGAPRRPLRPLLRQGYGGPTSPQGGEERESCFPRTCSGVWRRFRKRLSRTPARGRGNGESGESGERATPRPLSGG